MLPRGEWTVLKLLPWYQLFSAGPVTQIVSLSGDTKLGVDVARALENKTV